MNPATPTPRRWYPVSSAVWVNGFKNQSDKVIVFAASNGDSVDAMREMRHRMKSMTSRFHSGQFYYISIPV